MAGFLWVWEPKKLRSLRGHTRITWDLPNSLILVWAMAAWGQIESRVEMPVNKVRVTE